jgi:DnaK suppressor protein
MKTFKKLRLGAKSQNTRLRLSREYANLITSINRSRLAAKEIKIDDTGDEGDLAMISHDRALFYNLHEGGFARLRFIQEAIKALDRGQYGECVRCAKDIDEKRLEAVPWATMCILCQEEMEAEHTPSSMVMATLEAEETDL